MSVITKILQEDHGITNPSMYDYSLKSNKVLTKRVRGSVRAQQGKFDIEKKYQANLNYIKNNPLP